MTYNVHFQGFQTKTDGIKYTYILLLESQQFCISITNRKSNYVFVFMLQS